MMRDELHGVDEMKLFTIENWDTCMQKLISAHYKLYHYWPFETEQERKLRELAQTYHARCEAYDKWVCSWISPQTGEAMPLTPEEMREINRYALDQRDTAIVEGRRLGFTREQVEEAIRHWAK